MFNLNEFQLSEWNMFSAKSKKNNNNIQLVQILLGWVTAQIESTRNNSNI